MHQCLALLPSPRNSGQSQNSVDEKVPVFAPPLPVLGSFFPRPVFGVKAKENPFPPRNIAKPFMVSETRL